MGDLKIGLGTWSYTEPAGPGFDEVARRVAEAGYDGIELDGSDDWFSPSRYPSSADRRRLRDHVRGFGLEPCAYNPAHYSHDIATGDPDARAAYLEALRSEIELAAELEIPVVRLDTAQAPPGPESLSRDERVERVASVWHDAAGIAAQHGVRLAWEFEPGFMINSPSEVLAVAAAVDHDAFGFLFDTCHAHMVAEVGARQEDPIETIPGGSAELARRLAGQIALVHVIDSDGTIHDGFTSTHVPIGAGVIDFPAVLQACGDAGYSGPWFTVDLCFWPQPAAHEADCRARLEELLRTAPVAGTPR